MTWYHSHMNNIVKEYEGFYKLLDEWVEVKATYRPELADDLLPEILEVKAYDREGDLVDFPEDQYDSLAEHMLRQYESMDQS